MMVYFHHWFIKATGKRKATTNAPAHGCEDTYLNMLYEAINKIVHCYCSDLGVSIHK